MAKDQELHPFADQLYSLPTELALPIADLGPSDSPYWSKPESIIRIRIGGEVRAHSSTNSRYELSEGYDWFIGSSADESVFGFGGADTLEGGGGRDLLAGGDHSDTLIGGEGDDLLLGGFGADGLRGGEGADRIFGEEDDDIISSDPGNDIIDGGFGFDTYQISGGDSAVDLLAGRA